MEPRIYHGELTPEDIGTALMAEFNRGEYRAQKFQQAQTVIVQVATRQSSQTGGATALTISLQKVEDGVSVSLGNQNWFGVAASLGKTAFSVWRNPWSLVDRLDDIAQDIENIKLTESVWATIQRVTRDRGAAFQLSERLRRIECEYCSTGNPMDAPCCMACGAPLGGQQPSTCPHCGFVLKDNEAICPNCRRALPR